MTDSLLGNYKRGALAFTSGAGAWLTAEDGTRYLDCASGLAVTSLGHAHPALVEALREQAGKLWHVSNLYRIPEQEAVAELLTRLSGMEDARAFFCNSGTEATEAVVKMARRAMHARGEKERNVILCAEGAFHGRTIAMLAATHREDVREGFGPIPQGFAHVPFGNMNALRDTIAKDGEGGVPKIAAVMLEPIQGEGGARPLPDGFLAEARALCDEFGCFLIADEVQSGIGRTGAIFAYSAAGIRPDLVALAKGLGGGFPVGAALARKEIADAMTPGSHGSTFGGNPLAMRVAHAVLETLSAEGFMEGVRERAAYMMKGLEAIAARHKGMFTLRGAGFLIGLVMQEPYTAAGMTAALEAEKVLAVPASDNTARLIPPITINTDEIDIALAAVDKAASAMKG